MSGILRRLQPFINPFYKLVVGLLAVFLTLVILFFASQRLSDPVSALLPPDASAAEVTALRQELGLDRPLAVRFGEATGRLLRGDFGDSWRLRRPALPIVLGHFPATALLATVAGVVGLLSGVSMGLVLALLHRSRRGIWASFVPLGVQAFPGFVVAILSIQLLAVKWRLFPSSGRETLILAGTLLGLGIGSRLGLLLHSKLLTLVQEPFVLAALARGVDERAVYWRHLLLPAFSLVFSYASLQLGYLLAGSLVIETVFAYPGIGLLAVSAVSSRDLPLLMASVFVAALGFLILRFAADLLQLWLDPRLREQGGWS